MYVTVCVYIYIYMCVCTYLFPPSCRSTARFILGALHFWHVELALCRLGREGLESRGFGAPVVVTGLTALIWGLGAVAVIL